MNVWRYGKATAKIVGLCLLVAGCSRDHIEAINLANEGDQAVKVNVEGAIQKYEQAIQLDPSNHHILWKLALAYERRESWDKMASTLASAAALAPEWGKYWFRRGYALIQEAEDPLRKCIEKDPNIADCYFLLGEAHLWTSEDQEALVQYSKAIEHDPTRAYFYPPLAELYLTYRLHNEAKEVLTEGTKLVPLTEDTKANLYSMYTLLAAVAQLAKDKSAQLAALEKAQQIDGENHPEIAFNLGSTYAVLDPPAKEKATRLLNSFTKRACRGAQAEKFKEQCETASALIQKLGS
jgi:tetratricopeptide (TPR) repeat protein